MNYYIDAIKNYVNFDGRATRKEFWMFFLINFLIVFVVWLIDWMIWTAPVLWLVYNLFVFLPWLAISIRRLHDIGKSWWWYLIVLIPIIWAIWLLVLLVLSSDCDNKYWPNKYGKKCEDNNNWNKAEL